MLEERFTEDDVRVDGSGRTDLITLSGRSEMRYRGNSTLIFDAASLEAEGEFEVSAKQSGKKRNSRHNKILASPSRQNQHYGVKPVVEPSIEVIISGSQARTLTIDKPGTYYLIPIGVIKRVLRETAEFIRVPESGAAPLPFPGVKGHLKMLADRERERKSNISVISCVPSICAFYRELYPANVGGFHQQIEDMSRHIFPFWDSNQDFVLVDSIGPVIDFRTVKKGTLKLEGEVIMRLPHGFIANGKEYEAGRITGRGAVTLQGGIDKLALSSPLRVESDFARITGLLDLIRSDGIAKNWPTSVQISPASLQMSAKANATPNPIYWASLAGLSLTGLVPAGVVANFAGYWLNPSAVSAEVYLYSVLALFLTLSLAPFSNTFRVNKEKTIIRGATIESGYSGKLYTGIIKQSPSIR
ncbi:hypothetical protein HYU17_00015 [Candidatus Woesearchaeota archaeon]|nr:hypothetical protein [Candidatus Woesearchaeota archaeon]